MRTLALASLSLAALAGCSLTGEPRFVRPIVVADTSVVAMDSAADASAVDGAPDDTMVIGTDVVPPIDVVANDSVPVDDVNVIGTDAINADAIAADVGVACPASQTNCDDQCVNLMNNPRNCGACSRVCPFGPNSTATCSMGACGLACAPGFGNCDGDPLNGCETALDNVANCGGCGRVCPGAPGANPTCTGGTCGATCAPGFLNCDGSALNGCETLGTTPMNCGMCGRACSVGMVCSASLNCVSSCTGSQINCGGGCADINNDPRNCGGCGSSCLGGPNGAPSCLGGVCILTCAAGFFDCDGRLATGCETNIQNDVNNCGACGRVCPSGPGGRAVCMAGSCGFACDLGRLNCDGNVSNGCESLALSNENCGRCGANCGVLSVCTSAAGSAPACVLGPLCSLTDNVHCGLRCVDVETDPNNCGSCGNTCPSLGMRQGVCSGGRCSTCAIGSFPCNSGPNRGRCCSAILCGGSCVAPAG